MACGGWLCRQTKSALFSPVHISPAMLEGVTTSNIVQYPLTSPLMTINTSNYTLQTSSSDSISSVSSAKPAYTSTTPTSGTILATTAPTPLLKKALVANFEGSADANNKKRKRDASVSSASVSASEKRPRISVSTASAYRDSKAARNLKDARDSKDSKDSKRGSNARQNRSDHSERPSTPIRGQHNPLGPLSLTERWQPIPRKCAAVSSSNSAGNTISTAVDPAVPDAVANTISCYDIVKDNLNNFKECKKHPFIPL